MREEKSYTFGPPVFPTFTDLLVSEYNLTVACTVRILRKGIRKVKLGLEIEVLDKKEKNY